MKVVFVSIICDAMGHAAGKEREGEERKGKEKREKGKILTLPGIRTTHLLLSGQMSYPIRLEGT